jgi:hypothetical protein
MLGPTAKIRVAHQWGYPYQVRMYGYRRQAGGPSKVAIIAS